MCCTCAGMCNHVGNHWFCEAHGGSPYQPSVTAPNTMTWTFPQPLACGGVAHDFVIGDGVAICNRCEKVVRLEVTTADVDDIYGIDPDFTGGLDSVEYVRRLRGHEPGIRTISATHFTVPAEQLLVLFELALENGYRTLKQQFELLQVCRSADDNAIASRDFFHRASDSWEAIKCENDDCLFWIPVEESGLCEVCREKA